MLVFRRKQGESFKVGPSVEVRILRLGQGYVKLGVIAPREIEIVRTELSQLNRQAMLKDWSRPEVEESLRNLAEGLRRRGADAQR